MASEGYHEPIEMLRPETLDHHRAIISLMEELEAIDWYEQRVDATDDQALADILAHNRDEEKEHAAMVLEWLRRRDPVLDENLRTYLFTDGDITHVHDEVEADSAAPSGPGGGAGLGIGSLRDTHLSL